MGHIFYHVSDNSTLGSHRGLCLKQEGRNVSWPTHRHHWDLACPRLDHFQVNKLASARHELASAKNPKFTNLHFQLTTFMMVYSDMEPSLEDLRACGC